MNSLGLKGTWGKALRRPLGRHCNAAVDSAIPVFGIEVRERRDAPGGLWNRTGRRSTRSPLAKLDSAPVPRRRFWDAPSDAGVRIMAEEGDCRAGGGPNRPGRRCENGNDADDDSWLVRRSSDTRLDSYPSSPVLWLIQPRLSNRRVNAMKMRLKNTSRLKYQIESY